LALNVKRNSGASPWKFFHQYQTVGNFDRGWSWAIADGSDYLVIGRPIRDAKDPVWAARKIAEEIAGVLSAG